MKQSLLYCAILFLNLNFAFCQQSTEDFETEPAGAASFTDNGKSFNITSVTGEDYDVFTHGFLNGGAPTSTDNCVGCGWNGTTADNKWIDNTGAANNNGDNNGSSFTITTTGGEDISVQSLYLFCSTRTIAPHTGSITIEGKRNNISVYTITKSSGFANVTTFSPNNGFTHIDFATEGAADYSNLGIDELVFTGTGNLDYMALDAFTWDTNFVLSIGNFNTQENKITIFPNPSSNYLNIINASNQIEYEIYDLLGKKVSERLMQENNQIDIRNLENGVYFIKFLEGRTHKFIKR